MKRRFGIILIESTEIVFRIYESDGSDWKLLSYHSAKLFTITSEGEIHASDILEVIAEFLTTESAQHIAEWKACSRHIPPQQTDELVRGLGFKIENITPLREQELLCKGMFTELW